MSETNYQRYFGTPEKAAEWMDEYVDCYECPFSRDKCLPSKSTCKELWLEWLESEAK